MFLSHFSQAYSEEDQRHWFHQTIMQTTGHFEYVYKDNYFSNSYEWKQMIVYFFHWYFIHIVLYLYDEKWKYYFRVWNIIFIFVCSLACYWCEVQNRCILLLTDSFSRPKAYSHCEGSTPMLRKQLLICIVQRCTVFQKHKLWREHKECYYNN